MHLWRTFCRRFCSDGIPSNETKAILNRLAQLEGNIMSAISDWAARVGPKLDRVQQGLDVVQALVEKLQNTPGVLTPEDQALLDQIDAKIDAIATDADSVPAQPPVAT